MTVESNERDPEKTCEASDCDAWRTGDLRFCHHHQGMAKGNAGENNNRGQTHGLYVSEETFLANASESHKDAYHAIHESLCSRYEAQHGSLPTHVKKELSHVALDMVKLDMASEYQQEKAVDPEKPITERQLQDIAGDPMEVEAVSKVESLKTDIRRENRLLLKDMGIYNSPEQQQANATKTVVELLKED